MKEIIDQMQRYPRFVVWELTLRCNMKCRHCGSTAGRERRDELTHDEAMRLCDELAELGCERVTLLGGEPFVRKGWEDIAHRLIQGGVRCNGISNGYLFADERMADRIIAAGLSNLAISIDGLRETHDHIRNLAGSFDRCMAGFRNLLDRNFSAAAVTVITRQSLVELREIYKILVDHGVRVWQLQIGVPRGRLKGWPKWLIRPGDLLDLMKIVHELKLERRLRIDLADNIGYFGPYEMLRKSVDDDGQLPFWSGCYAGCGTLGIDSNGDIKGCASLPSLPEFIEGNVRREPLKEIWNKKGNFAYNREFTPDRLSGFCAECEFGVICRGGCLSTAYGMTGEYHNNIFCIHRAMKEAGMDTRYDYDLEKLLEVIAEYGYVIPGKVKS